MDEFEWDEAKRARNLARHGVDFAAMDAFEWETALVGPDLRADYGELRFVAIGLIGERLHVAVYTPRRRKRRIISLRKANAREIRKYLEAGGREEN